jgi:hypothetical protein
MVDTLEDTAKMKNPAKERLLMATRKPWFVALAVLTLPACVSTSEEPANPMSLVMKAARSRWERCLDKSFEVQRRTTRDENTAIELALTSCMTYEKAIADAHGVRLSRNDVDRLMSEARAQQRERLLKPTSS